MWTLSLSIQRANQGLRLICHTLFFDFTTLDHSNTLVEIGEVGEKLLALDYFHQKTTNKQKYSYNWIHRLLIW